MLNTCDGIYPNFHLDVKGHMIQRLRAQKVNEQVFEVIQRTFEKTLAEDQLVLSRLEKKRLLAQVLKSVLVEMNRQIDEALV